MLTSHADMFLLLKQQCMFRKSNAHKVSPKEACECCKFTFALGKTTFLDFTCVVSEWSGLVDCLLLAARSYKKNLKSEGSRASSEHAKHLLWMDQGQGKQNQLLCRSSQDCS